MVYTKTEIDETLNSQAMVSSNSTTHSCWYRHDGSYDATREQPQGHPGVQHCVHAVLQGQHRLMSQQQAHQLTLTSQVIQKVSFLAHFSQL